MDSRHPARAKSGATLHLVPSVEPPANPGDQAPGPRPFRRFALWRVLSLDGLAVLHYTAGCLAILAAYRGHPVLAWPLGLTYLVFATVQLFVLMPLVVCPGCVYRTIRDGRCPSGLNLISARLCPPSPNALEFRERSHGALCQSKLTWWSWIAPLPLALPGLALSFSWTAAAPTALVVALIAIRRLASRRAVCPHCLAHRWCPASRAGAGAGA